jgi:hypothetical protein
LLEKSLHEFLVDQLDEKLGVWLDVWLKECHSDREQAWR